MRPKSSNGAEVGIGGDVVAVRSQAHRPRLPLNNSLSWFTIPSTKKLCFFKNYPVRPDLPNISADFMIFGNWDLVLGDFPKVHSNLQLESRFGKVKSR